MSITSYLIPAIIAIILSLNFTWLVLKLAIKLNIVDRPNAARKFHARPVPLLGGLAIFTAFFLVLFL